MRQHDQLGDMLCAVPLLRAVRFSFPSAQISLVTSPVNNEIMKHHPYVNRVICYDKRTNGSLLQFVYELRSQQYDLAIVPATVSISLTSNLIALFSRSRWRVGPSEVQGIPNESSFCFTHPVELNWVAEPHRHQALRNLDIVQSLAISTEDLSGTIGLTESEIAEANEKLGPLRANSALLIGIHPGAGKPGNRWPARKFADLVNRLHQEKNAGIVITAGPMDGEALREVIRWLACPHLVISNESIRKVASIINAVDIFISNDTGIMHVAGATEAFLISLFGPTDPLQWAPHGTGNQYITAGDKDISSIDVEDVYSMVESMIAARPVH